jgi:hypothetical protein
MEGVRRSSKRAAQPVERFVAAPAAGAKPKRAKKASQPAKKTKATAKRNKLRSPKKSNGRRRSLEEWQILVEMRDDTGYADWTENRKGWDTLEEHKDPSQCAGVTVKSGKITKIDLRDSNLAGGESSFDDKFCSSVLTHISVLPESIGQLLSLESLDCSTNLITGTCT